MGINKSILALLDEFGASMTKQAEAESGKTTSVSEGSRASENSSDVKKNIPGNNVDSTSAVNSVPGAGENTPSNSIGTKSAPTGEDVPSTKSTKDDPGTSHPATAGGEKYASIDSMLEGGNALLASIAVFSKSAATKGKKAPVAPVAAATEPEKKEEPAVNDETVEVKAAEFKALTEKAANWEEFVGYMAGQDATKELMKSASTEDDELVKLASAEADRLYKVADVQTTDLIDFLLGLNSTEKQAEGEVDPALLAALAGGGDAGAGAAPAAPAVDPTAAAPVDGAGGEEIDPQTLALLVEALQAQGVSPDQLGAGDAALGDEGGDKGDAVDSARAAAAAEPGSDDETEGAKEEAGDNKDAPAKQASAKKWTKKDHEKAAALYAKFVKKAVEVAKNNKKK